MHLAPAPWGLAIVKGGKITAKHHWLIRPPQDYFRADSLTDIHGITAAAVRNCPSFKEIWPEVKPLKGLAWRRITLVLTALCCKPRWNTRGLALPAKSFEKIFELSRHTWKPPKNNLAAVANYLDLPLQHHQAESDTGLRRHSFCAADYWQCTSIEGLIDKPVCGASFKNVTKMSWLLRSGHFWRHS